MLYQAVNSSTCYCSFSKNMKKKRFPQGDLKLKAAMSYTKINNVFTSMGHIQFAVDTFSF